jgi:hypothetical protein
VGEVRRQLAAYKKFNTLTRKWVALAMELSKIELEEARSATPTMRWPPGLLSLHRLGESRRILR